MLGFLVVLYVLQMSVAVKINGDQFLTDLNKSVFCVVHAKSINRSFVVSKQSIKNEAVSCKINYTMLSGRDNKKYMFVY